MRDKRMWFVLIGAATLRFISSGQSFWLDEAAQAIESARPLSQQLNLTADFQPPLFHLVVAFLMQWSKTEQYLRLASIIPGIFTIYFTFKIAKKLFNNQTGILAALLLASSNFHIFYSQELRPYSLATFLAVCAVWQWLNLMESRRWSWSFVFVITAGLYTMYVFPIFIIFLLIATALLYQNQIKFITKHFFAATALFAPWIPSFINQLSAGLNLTTSLPGWSQVVSPPPLKGLLLTFGKFLVGRLPLDLNGQSIIAGILVGVGMIMLIWKARSVRNFKFTLLWLFSPILLAFLISYIIPILEPKRVMLTLPALWILIATGVNQLKSKHQTLAIGILLVINLSITLTYFQHPVLQREDWRQAVAQIELNAPKNSLVISAFPEPFAPWQWYQKRNLSTLSLPTNQITDPEKLNTTLRPALSFQRTYVFEYLMDLTDRERLIINWCNNHLQPVEIINIHGIGFIYVYKPLTSYAETI